MRRLIAAVAALVLVQLGAAPAHAAEATVTIDGFGYPPGLSYVHRACGATPDDGNATALYRQGGAIGTHATGLSFTSTASEAGLEVAVATPSALNEITFETLHPAGPTGSVPGSFYVSLDPSGGGFSSFYYAEVNLPVSVSSWGVWDDLADWPFDWYFWNGASSSGPYEVDTTIAQMANSYGNGSGVRFGVLFGCDGREFYLDNLRVGVDANTTVYDFEGVPSATYLSGYAGHHTDHFVQGLTRLKLVTGQGHWLAGDGWSLGDTVTGTGWFNGTARLFAKSYGRSSYSLVGTQAFTTEDRAWFKIRPRKNTSYLIDTPGTNMFEASTSSRLDVSVSRRVKARIADSTIIRGNRIRASGYIKPRTSGITVTLQHRTRAGWRNVDKGRTGRAGAYSLAARAGTVGKWKVRVVAAGGKGNSRGKSLTATVTVKAPPPKPAPEPTPVPVPIPDPAPDPDPPVPQDPNDPKAGRVMLRDVYHLSWRVTTTVPPAAVGEVSSGDVRQRSTES